VHPNAAKAVFRAPLERKNAAFPFGQQHVAPPATTARRPPALLSHDNKCLHLGVGVSLSVNNVLLSHGKSEHRKLDRSISEPAEKARPTQANSSRYKTELCRPFEESGSCKYGDKCQFAHGMHELRNLTRHPKYKTELCRTFHTTGFCPYGPRCHFIHNSEETKKTVISSLQAGFPVIRSHRIVGRSSTADVLMSSAGTGSLMNNSSGNHLNQQNQQSSSDLKGKSLSPQIRPKAMSVSDGSSMSVGRFSMGSSSIGSSGDLTPPSSPSGSPTSLGSFFAEEAFHSLSLGPAAAGGLHALHPSAGLFSFSPDFSGLFTGQQQQQVTRRASDSATKSGGSDGAGSDLPHHHAHDDQHQQQRVNGKRCSAPGMSSLSYPHPGVPSSPDDDSQDSDLEHMGLAGSSPDSCCGSPLDNQKQAIPRLPTFARFANNNSLESE
jgi:hypothetical protein